SLGGAHQLGPRDPHRVMSEIRGDERTSTGNVSDEKCGEPRPPTARRRKTGGVWDSLENGGSTRNAGAAPHEGRGGVKLGAGGCLFGAPADKGWGVVQR